MRAAAITQENQRRTLRAALGASLKKLLDFKQAL
jgi:hypothetical protein